MANRNSTVVKTVQKSAARKSRQSTISRRPKNAAWGRWLGDLIVAKEGGALSRLEKKLLVNCKMGLATRVTPNAAVPDKKTNSNTVRASLIRFLAMGGDALHPVHEDGIELQGAWIDGELDFFACTARVGVELSFCRIPGRIILQYSTMPSLILTGSHINRTDADGAKFVDDLRIDNIVSAEHLCLTGVYIGGDLDCTSSKLGQTNANSLIADRCAVKGDVFLSDGFSAEGEVRFIGSRVEGDFDCRSGHFINPDGRSIDARGITVFGDVNLRCKEPFKIPAKIRKNGSNLEQTFYSYGTVDFEGADISGDFDLSNGVFLVKDKTSDALNLAAVEVKDCLIIKGCKIDGKIDLKSAYCGTLIDDLASWPKPPPRGAGLITLDGFRYDRIVDGPTHAAQRLEWLGLQRPHYLNQEKFAPQPWEQLIRVLRDMGHGRDANQLALEKQVAMAKAKRVGTRVPKTRFWIDYTDGSLIHRIRCWIDKNMWNWINNFVTRAAHSAYGLLAGYGYRPTRVLLWMLLVWAIGALYFGHVARTGIMAPSDSIVFAHAYTHDKNASLRRDMDRCGVRGEVISSDQYWVNCADLSSEYTTFNALVYSADLILPFVDLQQENDWAPAVTFVDGTGQQQYLSGSSNARLLLWFEIIFGWVGSLMFVAVVTRLVERD